MTPNAGHGNGTDRNGESKGESGDSDKRRWHKLARGHHARRSYKNKKRTGGKRTKRSPTTERGGRESSRKRVYTDSCVRLHRMGNAPLSSGTTPGGPRIQHPPTELAATRQRCCVMPRCFLGVPKIEGCETGVNLQV
jgi:hypothetical protein